MKDVFNVWIRVEGNGSVLEFLCILVVIAVRGAVEIIYRGKTEHETGQ